MRKIRPLAMAMSMVMLMTVFVSSCSSAKKTRKVVKEDDPWYKTTKFELSTDLGQNDYLGTTSALCSSDNNLFYMYNFSYDRGGSYRTVLDTFDFEGNRVSRSDVICPDEYRIVKIYSLKADNDGKKLNSVLHLRSGNDFDVYFADIDTQTGAVSNIRKLINGVAEMVLKPKASLMVISNTGDYTVAVFDIGFNGGFNIEYQALLFKNNEFIAELDISSLNLRYFFGGTPLDEKANSIYLAGLENSDVVSMEFDLETGALKNKSSFSDLSDNDVNLAEYFETDNGELCKLDSFGNIIRIDMNTMTPETVIDGSSYNPYFYPLSTEEKSVGSGVVSLTEDRAILYESESVLYGSDDNKYREYIIVLTKEDKNPNAGKEIIELALPQNTGVSDYLAKSVYEFNRTDNEYIIRVWSKYNSGYNMGVLFANANEDDQKVFEMIQDLKGDEAPDLVVGIQKNYAMRDDVFMDLTGFLDPEVMAKQYGNIIEAGKLNDKLFFLPVTIEIEGLVTKKDLLRDGAVGITFEEYDKLIEEDMNGFSPYDYPLSEYYNRNSFILSCIDTKSAIEGERIEFGTDQFRATIEYAEDKFTYEDAESIPLDVIYDSNRNRGVSYYSRINDYLDFVHACYNDKDQFTIIGTPSVDASGPRFKALETISVSAATDVKDGCRKFINYLFAGTAFESDECEFWQIVTNKEIMEKNMATLTKNSNKAYEHLSYQKNAGLIMQTGAAEKANGDKMATDEMCESFRNSMASVSTYYYEDRVIVQFINEELAPYYAGDRTLDDAIKILNDRVTKYVNEM